MGISAKEFLDEQVKFQTSSTEKTAFAASCELVGESQSSVLRILCRSFTKTINFATDLGVADPLHKMSIVVDDERTVEGLEAIEVDLRDALTKARFAAEKGQFSKTEKALLLVEEAIDEFRNEVEMMEAI